LFNNFAIAIKKNPNNGSLVEILSIDFDTFIKKYKNDPCFIND